MTVASERIPHRPPHARPAALHAALPEPAGTTASVLRLQWLAGNGAVSGLLAARETSPARPATSSLWLPPGPAGLVLPVRQELVVVQRELLPVQLWGFPGRLITTPFSTDLRKVAGYVIGWAADVLDLVTQGHFFDAISLIYAGLGATSATVLVRIEEAFRYVLNHPEIVDLLGGAPLVAQLFGIPEWVARVALVAVSRGAVTNLIATYVFSFVPRAILDYLPAWLLRGLMQRTGRSLLNRVLGVTYALAPGGSRHVVSAISRILHGYGITGGSLLLAPAPALPGQAFWFDPVARRLMPVERLHVIPNLRGGPMTILNAFYGAAGSNTLMIPLEARGIPAIAITTPAGVLHAMVMNNGVFLVRGMRGLAGQFEHALASKFKLA